MKQRDKIFLGFIIVFFAAIYCCISLVNHYNFRTYAWDLGIINNSIYDYAHFRWNDCMVMQPQFTNLLSDHFTLLPVLLSPLYWILGSYAMLVVQIAAILFGGYGIFLFIKLKSNDVFFSLLAMTHFFLLWGIYSALAFDFHDNVVGAMFVPWIFYFFEKNDRKKTFLFFALLLISKENLALWAVFIAIGIALMNYKEKSKLKFGIFLSIIAGIYFLAVVKIVMPSLANAGRSYLHFQYDSLGKNFSEAFMTMLTHPKHIFTLLFENHLSDPVANGIKSELHFIILASGGFALLYRPAFLIMLIPIYAQKLFNDDYGKWGLNAQYSIEFAPILTIALFIFLFKINKPQLKKASAIIMVLLTAIITKRSLDNRVSKWYAPERHQFYKAEHYSRNFNVKQVYEALKLIPENANVSASTSFVPHLAFRDSIYQFPVVMNAQYIALLADENPYPLSKEEMNKEIIKLLSSSEWSCIYKENFTWIFQRK